MWYVRLAQDKEISQVMVPPPATLGPPGEIIMSRVLWVDNDTVSVTWMNRIQSKSVLVHCKLRQKVRCRNVHAESEEGVGWVALKRIKYGPVHTKKR